MPAGARRDFVGISGILHVRPKVVYTFCDFEKTLFFLICNIFLQNQHVTGD
jgi:hypothetical protein